MAGPSIQTLDGKYRLSGGDLAEMAARWHAAQLGAAEGYVFALMKPGARYQAGNNAVTRRALETLAQQGFIEANRVHGRATHYRRPALWPAPVESVAAS